MPKFQSKGREDERILSEKKFKLTFGSLFLLYNTTRPLSYSYSLNVFLGMGMANLSSI